MGNFISTSQLYPLLRTHFKEIQSIFFFRKVKESGNDYFNIGMGNISPDVLFLT